MFTLDICVGWITLSYQELKGDQGHHTAHNHDALLWSRCKPFPVLRAFEPNFKLKLSWPHKLNQTAPNANIKIYYLPSRVGDHPPQTSKLFNWGFELLILQNIGCFYITGPSILPPFLKYFNP